MGVVRHETTKKMNLHGQEFLVFCWSRKKSRGLTRPSITRKAPISAAPYLAVCSVYAVRQRERDNGYADGGRVLLTRVHSSLKRC